MQILRALVVVATLAAHFAGLSAAHAQQPAGKDPPGEGELWVRWPPEPREPLAIGEPIPLIPRADLLGNPARNFPRLSPDGQRIAWLAPVNGVMNVWVARVNDLRGARAVSNDTFRGIRSFTWAHTSNHILFPQDTGGDENFRVYCVDLETGKTRNLTPFENARSAIQQISHKFPGEALLTVNNRDPRFFDLHRADLATGALTLVAENPGATEAGVVGGFVTDEDFNVRFALRTNAQTGSTDFLRPDGAGGWAEAFSVPLEDSQTTSPVGFSADGNTLYMTDSRGRDTAALVEADPATGAVRRVVAEDPRADAANVMLHPTKNTVQAVSFNRERTRWQFLDLTFTSDFFAFEQKGRGEVAVVSRTLDDRTWLVEWRRDSSPPVWFLFNRDTREERFLFGSRPALSRVQLAEMHPVAITARDGLELVSYLSLPINAAQPGQDRPNRALPMILLVHGGPWARDAWGYNTSHQLWTNRGYAVLSVNFRGSTGFGKSFVNAGNREWAGKMHDDLLDAVRWAVDNRVADPDKVAIMGGSYGGYAALVGMTFTPEVFACGVSIVGPSNIVTLLNTIPPYWAPLVRQFRERVGDWTTEEGRAFLMERSPLTRVEAIRRPLLIGQGANDPRVKQAESDQIVEAMRAKNIPVTYVLFPDEGHGFARPENNTAFMAVTEQFLAGVLGGAAEPIGEAFKGSSITVPAGPEHIPGLSGALPTSP